MMHENNCIEYRLWTTDIIIHKIYSETDKLSLLHIAKIEKLTKKN